MKITIDDRYSINISDNTINALLETLSQCIENSVKEDKRKKAEHDFLKAQEECRSKGVSITRLVNE